MSTLPRWWGSTTVYDWAVEHNIPPRGAIATRWARAEAAARRWIA